MKEQLQAILVSAINQLKNDGVLPSDLEPRFQVDRTKDQAHGDLASNIALTTAKAAGIAPREMAKKVIDALSNNELIAKVDIAGPGFINFFLVQGSTTAIVKDILDGGAHYGRSEFGQNKGVHIEFVSANPTGPLHVGHGRGACYGAAVADLLEAVGFKVHREYYVNDAGRQMHILATSVWLRYLELQGLEFNKPSNYYKGDYIVDIAQSLLEAHAEQFIQPIEKVFADVPADEDENGNGDKEAHIDGLIANAKKLLADDYQIIFKTALDNILDGIKNDLAEFGITYQQWFSEQSLFDSGAIPESIKRLTEKNYMYEKDGAIWFKSTEFGDDKDRVVQRSNGDTTYFASDIAYHMNKLDRGNEYIVNVLGADHHGYIARVKAAMQALGADPEKLDVPLIQFVQLLRDGEVVPMSTRSGSFITLKALGDEIGQDATRFFYVMRKADQHQDFDLDLAKSKSNENPLYYIQYAHARTCRIFEKLEENNLVHDEANGLANLDKLSIEQDNIILKELNKYKEIVHKAAINHEPHLLANYLKELAASFHSFYNLKERRIIDIQDAGLRDACICLSRSVRQVLANGLKLLGVSAPESM